MKNIYKFSFENHVSSISKIINYLLFATMIVIACSFLIIFIDSLCNKGITFFLSKEGVINMQSWWGNYSFLLNVLFSVTTLFLANLTLTRYLKEYKRQGNIEETKAIIEIRKLLDSDPDNFRIHTDLELEIYEFSKKEVLGNDYKELNLKSLKRDQRERIKCYRYLGIIELASIMVQRDIITIEQFKNQFEYRIINIFRCKNLHEHLIENRTYWKNLLWIKNEIEKSSDNSI